MDLMIVKDFSNLNISMNEVLVQGAGGEWWLGQAFEELGERQRGMM